MTRTAKLLHGIGPYNLPNGGDRAYIEALPADLQPAFAHYRLPLGKPDTPWGPLLDKWLTAEKTAGRTTAIVSCWPHIDLGDGKTQLLDNEVAAGQYDESFRAIAQAIAKYAGKVYFTLRSECNGNWPAGSSVPYVYVTMFRRVAAIMAQYGGGKVSMTWHVHAQGSDPFATGWHGWNPWASKLYPGDKYVGTFGLSIFEAREVRPGSQPYKFCEAFCAQAVKRGKPVILGETSCAMPGVDDQHAIEDFIQPRIVFLEAHPEIVAFSEHSHDWRTGQGFATWKDGRLTKNPAVWAAWLAFLRRGYVVHGKS